MARCNRGYVWDLKKEYARALADYDEAIRQHPEDARPYNNQAWILATCPDAKFRDGPRAVTSATRAGELSQWKDARVLGALAAACAEAGQFAKAAEWQAKAIGMIADAKDKQGGEARLALYREGKPYREEPGP